MLAAVDCGVIHKQKSLAAYYSQFLYACWLQTAHASSQLLVVGFPLQSVPQPLLLTLFPRTQQSHQLVAPRVNLAVGVCHCSMIAVAKR